MVSFPQTPTCETTNIEGPQHRGIPLCAKKQRIDWQPLGATAPAFEAMMLKTPVGEVSEVFESQFGFHFLEVLDKRNYDRTMDIVEDRAYGALFSRKFDEELENSLRTMRAEAFVEVKELD